jgi:hypothetical protein
MKIAELGLSLTESGSLTVDTTIWTTQANLTKKLGLKKNQVSERVRRGIKNGTVKTYYIQELNTRLIPNVNNINELGGRKKKQQK